MLAKVTSSVIASVLTATLLGTWAIAFDIFRIEEQIQAAVDRMRNEIRLDIIECRIDDIVSRNLESTYERNGLGGYQFFFSEEDCGGKLPTTDYHAVLNTLLVCGGQDNFEVLALPDDKYGAAVYGTPLCNNHKSILQISYVRTPEAT